MRKAKSGDGQTRSIPVRVVAERAPSGRGAAVDYRWDADTSILTASLRARRSSAAGATAGGGGESLGVGDPGGSWLVLDVDDGALRGVEVAIWPDLRHRGTLLPPADVEDAVVCLAPPADGGAVELESALLAECDAAERTIHFRLGRAAGARAVRIARDVLVDIDAGGALAGLWLLNVPPSPSPPDDP